MPFSITSSPLPWERLREGPPPFVHGPEGRGERKGPPQGLYHWEEL